MGADGLRTQIILALIDIINESSEFKAEFIRTSITEFDPKNSGLPDCSIFVENTNTNVNFNIIVNTHAEVLVFLLHTIVAPDGSLWYVGTGGNGHLVSTIPLSHPISIELVLKELRTKYWDSSELLPTVVDPVLISNFSVFHPKGK